MTTRNRRIGTEVVRLLTRDARGRCCVCGQLVALLEGPLDLQEEILQKHHLVYFSEGGANIADNLVLVCPSCHARIHRRPDIFTLDKVREAKTHWSRMRALVPRDLDYEPYVDEPTAGGSSVPVPFELLTFGLDYSIRVPMDLTVRVLGRFIDALILQPVLAFARLAPFKLMLGDSTFWRGGLALKSDHELRIDPSRTVGDLSLAPADALVALVQVHGAAAPANEVLLGSVVLEWSALPRDLDLHFQVNSGGEWQAISFRNKGSLSEPPFAQLDRDVTTGFGPETIQFGVLSRAKYRILVHNFSGESPLGGSSARIAVAIGDKFYELRCKGEGHGRWWYAFDIDSERMEVVPVNLLLDAPPASEYGSPQ